MVSAALSQTGGDSEFERNWILMTYIIVKSISKIDETNTEQLGTTTKAPIWNGQQHITGGFKYTLWDPHYENTPIQIYWKFYHQKMAIFQIKKSDIFIFLLKA